MLLKIPLSTILWVQHSSECRLFITYLQDQAANQRELLKFLRDRYAVQFEKYFGYNEETYSLGIWPDIEIVKIILSLLEAYKPGVTMQKIETANGTKFCQKKFKAALRKKFSTFTGTKKDKKKVPKKRRGKD